MHPVFKRFMLFGVLLPAIWSCSARHQNGNPPQEGVDQNLLSSLNAQQSSENKSISYVIKFPSTAEARAHADAVSANGAKVSFIGKDQRILSVNAEKSALTGLTVPAAASFSLNTRISVQDGSQKTRPTMDDLFTSRKVLGVEDMVKRFPGADGRNVKVAVFDSGVEFGVEGLSRNSKGDPKVTGFFDLSGFGQMSPTPLADSTPRKKLSIGNAELAFEGNAQQLISAGYLDESTLAKGIWASQFDFNSNKKIDDKIPYVVGTNSKGQMAVWIDLNLDGVLAAEEELTDFNSTYKFLDASPTSPPSGANPIAVTIRSPTDLQFHQVKSGHGTSCALIVAGDSYVNGHWKGMAPGAQILAYPLDPAAEDFYDIEQLIRMFQHAKEQNVDAITISYVFTTGDLTSARFLSDFLDKEIASAGILIGFGVGNDGPGFKSGEARDYIPHSGLSVGAFEPALQIQTQHGRTGPLNDKIAAYSSFGPTRGGRATPDLISPTTTITRGLRNAKNVFRPFSGTSSATPALIGASAAAFSQLKMETNAKVDPRLWKLALQNSALPLPVESELRQGAGLPDVSKALDIYRRLFAEVNAARSDLKKRMPFAYDLRAKTELEESTLKGEGVSFTSFRPQATVEIKMSEESASLIDQTVSAEAMELRHQENFFEIPQAVLLQASGVKFGIDFNNKISNQPGIYTDIIKVVRPADGIVLLRIPVLITIPSSMSEPGDRIAIDNTIAPGTIHREMIELKRATPLRFLGTVFSAAGADDQRLLTAKIISKEGRILSEKWKEITHGTEIFNLDFGTIPPGKYEWIVNQEFYSDGTQAKELKVTGALTPASLRLKSLEFTPGRASSVLEATEATKISGVNLQTLGEKRTYLMQRTPEIRPGVEGFRGIVDLGNDVDKFEIKLAQASGDIVEEAFVDMEVTVRQIETKKVLYRSTVVIPASHTNRTEIKLSEKARNVEVLLYPGVVNWKTVRSQAITLNAYVPFAEPLHATPLKFETALELRPGQLKRIDIVTSAIPAPETTFGKIEMTSDEDDKTTLDFE